MYFFIITLHVLVAFALIFVVLIQAGKGGSLGAVFGGGSQAIFGPRGAGNFLTKLTTIVAILFMVTSLVLTVLSIRPQTSSIMEKPKKEGHQTEKHTTTDIPLTPSQETSTPQEVPQKPPQSPKAETPPSSKP